MKTTHKIRAVFTIIALSSSFSIAQDADQTEMQKRILLRSATAKGNTTRIQNVLTKAMNKEPLVIGVIGGSITEGAAASRYQNQYGHLVADWFKATFPKTPITYINAGIGATSSNMGTHRVDDTLLRHKPDLVICEYAVNDNGNSHILETMEGLVRQVLKSEKQPALILFFMCDQKGKNEQDKHILIGKHYDLPMISFRDALYPEIEAGTIKWEDIEADAVHPNDRGHRYGAELITDYVQKILDSMPESPKIKPIEELPKPITSNPFEYTTMFCTRTSVAAMNKGWITTDDRGPYRQFFGNGWLSEKPGSTLEFDIKGTSLSLVYHLDKQKDYGMIQVQVDDREPEKHSAYVGWIWDGGMCVWKPVASDLAYGWHKIKITLLDEKDKDSTGTRFRLMAVMASGRN
ncbi:MAG: hypothetical protein JXB18_04065 [Sedimentisphaerales bacterium]|nr:hypothetical protein [Sedimentisphaerales bacterium]